MKTIANIILILSIILSTTNVYADGTKGYKSNESKSEKAGKVITKLENAFETEMSLEAWMSEVKEFVAGENFTEAEMELENWMVDNYEFSADILVETEMEVEEWMIDSDNFTESEIVLESWMSNIHNEEIFIDEDLQVEDWMINFKK